ncbi:sugar transferase [Terrabacter ginsenosidimutans]|uniref:Sugar transferase n=1 Tax=Terrabacter ginsenosidimutans TaxID=490575 RepID=A0ABP7E1Z4_9MICO
MRHPFLKRTIDIVVAGPLLILSLPVQVLVALMVRRRLGSPVLFRQQRPGLHGEPFTLVKFRTMEPVRPELGLVDDHQRMTDLGRVLRAMSLDELPTLWNVLRGDMSLVGPRPLLLDYLPLYSAAESRRHAVRPGVTGLAQVSGRNGLAWSDRLATDVWYVNNWSVGLDVKILARTVGVVVGRRGVSEEGSVTSSTLTQHRLSKHDNP